MGEVIAIRKNDYWGLCPKCKGEPLFRNISRYHWAACDKHRVKWCIGENLFSGWRDETLDTWEANELELSEYRGVKPFYWIQADEV